MTEWFPPSVSTFGADIDSLFVLILWITGIIFVLVEGTLIYFAIKYRKSPDRRARHTHGNVRAEVIWTVIPFVLVIYIAAVSVGPWQAIKNPQRFPEPGLVLNVEATQFEWLVTYPGPDGMLGTEDDFVRRNQVHIPVGTPVVVNLTADDVIHSFFLPDFRVKQDAVPGMVIPVWFQPTAVGEYPLGCAELCGLGHYRMRGSVTVHEVEAFDAWMLQEGQETAVETPAPADTAGVDLEAASTAPAPEGDHPPSHQPASEGKERA